VLYEEEGRTPRPEGLKGRKGGPLTLKKIWSWAGGWGGKERGRLLDTGNRSSSKGGGTDPFSKKKRAAVARRSENRRGKRLRHPKKTALITDLGEKRNCPSLLEEVFFAIIIWFMEKQRYSFK